MNFEKFIENAKCEKSKLEALKGFNERQKARDEKFEAEAKSREPKADWYERSYDI